LAAAAFLAPYSGRTLDAYRHDLRMFVQWAADYGLASLKAARPHIELYHSAMEERRLAASTIDRRLSSPTMPLTRAGSATDERRPKR
jgi:site-specific recombinase XerD